MRARRWIVPGLLALLGLLGPLPVACATADLGEEEAPVLPDRADASDEPPPFDAGVLAPDVAQPKPDSSVPVDSSVPPIPRVFVSSTASISNVGGLAGADLACTNLAISAGLIGKWAAWLSVQGGPHASDRVTSAGPWSLVSGEVVAMTKAQLVSGTLAHAIDHDEKGTLVPASRVWTGSGVDGRYLTNDCDKWGNNGGSGRVGDSSSTTTTWTTTGVDGCGQLRRLYCFQL